MPAFDSTATAPLQAAVYESNPTCHAAGDGPSPMASHALAKAAWGRGLKPKLGAELREGDGE